MKKLLLVLGITAVSLSAQANCLDRVHFASNEPTYKRMFLKYPPDIGAERCKVLKKHNLGIGFYSELHKLGDAKKIIHTEAFVIDLKRGVRPVFIKSTSLTDASGLGAIKHTTAFQKTVDDSLAYIDLKLNVEEILEQRQKD